MKKIILACMVVLLLTSGAFAEKKTYTTTAEYVMGYNDTMITAQKKAVEMAVRTAAEEVGMYINSFTEVKNNVLTEDVIESYVATQAKVKDKKFVIVKSDDNAIHVTATVISIFDTEAVKKASEKYYEDKQKEKIASLSPNKEMKIQLPPGKNARECLERALTYVASNDYQSALNEANRAISMEPKNKRAYETRADIYNKMGDSMKAMYDYSVASSLK